ncbi:MAG: hypothetical protein WCX47_02090 [Bacilli bacterium]|jgi:hypothetical protein|nr:hypothetical protein [Bacilli bacterium]
MISAIILFGSFFFGLLGVIFYLPIMAIFVPDFTISSINVTPMLVFPILIVFFAVCVHFISDKTMDKISGAGNIMIKLAPYLVISSFLLFVAYCIHGKDFMLFIPYYWLHNHLSTFDILFIIIQFIIAFLIGLSIFSTAGFSYDKYVDVTYERTASGGDFETNRSDSYTSRSQFYVIALIGIFIGALMSFTAFTIVIFVLFFSSYITRKFRTKIISNHTKKIQIYNKNNRRHILSSLSLAIVTTAAVTLGVLINDHRLENPKDIMSIALNDKNEDDYLDAYLDGNLGYTYNETHYDLILALKLFSKNSAYKIEGLQIHIDLTYQKIEVETGEVQEVLTYDETLDFDYVYSTLEIYEITPFIDSYPTHTAYEIVSQSIDFIRGIAKCRYHISDESPYFKIGSKDLDRYFLVGTGYPEEDGYHYFFQSLNNIYIKELSIKIITSDDEIVELNLADTFVLKDQRIEFLVTGLYQDISLFTYDYFKGYVASFYVN